MADLSAGGSGSGTGGGTKLEPDQNAIFTIGYDDRQVRQALRDIQAREKNLAAVYRIWGEYMLLSIDDNYVSEQDPFGRPWRPLSPFTRAMKKALGLINKILQARGLMRQSYNYRISSTGTVVGTKDAKAFKHQFGVGVPVRQHLGVSTSDLAELKLSLLSYVVDGGKSKRIPK